ncbi:MAG: hypothetical protein ACR2NR_09940 [Solirubrobacteraceae bacterium]
MGDRDRASLVQGLGRALRQPWRLNQAARYSIDAFVQRYASARGLAFDATDATPPATWFLETVVPDKSHSYIHGPLAGGAEGTLFYVEKPVRSRKKGVMQGWTVALYELPESRQLAYGLAWVWRRPESVWGGRVKLSSALPRGMSEFGVGDDTLDERHLTAISSETDGPAVGRLFTDDFVAWLNQLPWQRTGDGVIRFELRNGVLCVYVRDKLKTEEALDEFCARAARIAAEIRSASLRDETRSI